MKILVYGLNYSPELTGVGQYTAGMCESLSRAGFDIRVICAPPYYPQWSIGPGYRSWLYTKEIINGIEVRRCPLYIPKNPTALSRFAHLVSFALSSFPIAVLQLFWKPALIICIEPTLFCAPGAILLSRLIGARTLLHIQDYELDAMLRFNILRRPWTSGIGQALERWIMRRYDAISSISLTMIEIAKSKAGQGIELLYFPNWVDTEVITPQVDRCFYRRLWDIKDSTRVVLYSGNVGRKQGLDLLLEAASTFDNANDLLFVIVGAGAALPELKQRADHLGLSNVKFYPPQPMDLLPRLLALADVHIVPQKTGAADAVLPSKLGPILSAGGFVLIVAEAGTELGTFCQDHPDMAVRAEPENLHSLLDALKQMLSTIDTQHRKINLAARSYAQEHMDERKILRRITDHIGALGQKQ